MVVGLAEFEETDALVRADERGRLALGTATKDKMYSVSRNSIGQILLTPVVAIPEHEVWLWRNPDALASVQRGLAEAAAAPGKAADFSAYAELDVED